MRISSRAYGTRPMTKVWLTVFVMADNCTDATADIARREGAVVYTRFNREKVGKGYALEQLLLHIEEDYPKVYDGFFVFDADNVLDCRFVEEMNRTFSDGYEVVTSYRNSKTRGQLDFRRLCPVVYPGIPVPEQLPDASGHQLRGVRHGFLFSRQVMESTNGWKFHLLTEDIEFSVHHILQGRKIGFCADAVLYG